MDQHTLPSDQMPYTVLPPTNFRVDGDEDELSDSEYTEAYLEYRIRRDMARLKRIREKEAIEQNHYKNDPNYTARRKKFSRIQDSVLEQLHKAMESCNARGFVYGIIPENGKPATGASDNLREWWKEKVRFDRNAPLAIENYAAQLMSPNSEQAREINIRDKLLKIHDTTLGSLLSSLMPHCDPPQRTFPLENGIPPPWWPTTNKEWWTELGFPTDKGTPPYKKPHDLKKLWKVGVVIGVLKHLCPHTNKARQLIKHSKSLQDRMTARDCILWSEVLDQLDRDYQKQHQNFPKLFDAGGSSHDCNVVTVDSQSNIRYEVDMSEESNMIYGRKRSAPFLAEDHNQRFFTNRAQFGPYMNFSGGNLVMTSEMNLNSNFNPSHYLTGANTQRIGYGQYGGSMNQSNDNIFGNIAHTEYNGYEENGGSVSQSNNNNFGNTAHTQFDGHGQYGGPMNQSNDNLNVQFAATQDNGFSGMRYSDEAMRMNGSDEWFGTGYC